MTGCPIGVWVPAASGSRLSPLGSGNDMWPGPYGDGGSRKYLLASLEQSLRRLGLDYVDIFYAHRYDPDTPLEETMGALNAACARARRCTSGTPLDAVAAELQRLLPAQGAG